jgi:hypothetical protein
MIKQNRRKERKKKVKKSKKAKIVLFDLKNKKIIVKVEVVKFN